MPRPLLLILLLLLALTSCDRTSTSPDPTPTPHPRIVALSPAIAITLRDIGAAHLLVGRHGFDAWSAQSIPVCGDQSGIDYETLLAVRPTHILIQWGQRDLPPRLADLARRHGWTVESFNPLTLDEVRAMAVSLAASFTPNSPPDQSRVAAASGDPAWLTALDRAWSSRDDSLARAGRILILHGVSPPNALGPGSFHFQILQRLGATPAITTGAPYITLDAEDVAALRPDAIILLAPRPPAAPAAESRTGPIPPDQLPTTFAALARLDIPAVRTGRVAIVDDPECLLPSTSLVRFAEDLRAILRGWAEQP